MRQRLVNKNTEIDSADLPKAVAKASTEFMSVLRTMKTEVAQSGFCAQKSSQDMQQEAENKTRIASAA